MLRDRLRDYLAWAIFNMVSYPQEPDKQEEAWAKLDGGEKAFANDVFCMVEALEAREMEEENGS